jgi:hypothetical protein
MFLNRLKGAAAIAPLALAVLARAEVTFQVTDLYTSKNGNPYTPKFGEDYELTAKWKMIGGPAKQSYNIAIRMADREYVWEVTNLNQTDFVTVADFGYLPLDGAIPIQFEADPYGYANGADKTKSKIPLHIPDPISDDAARRIVAVGGLPKVIGSRIKKGFFTPKYPDGAIEYYGPKYFLGAMSLFFDIKPGSNVSRIAAMMGTPITDSWQKQLTDYAEVNSPAGEDIVKTIKVENPSDYPVHLWDRGGVPAGKVGFIQQYLLELRNVRVNIDKLRLVTWQQLDNLKAINIFKWYMQPEKVIQSNDPKVKQFVTSVLGSNYRSHYKPYDAARKLFQAVLKHCVYTYPKPGEKDQRAQNAVDMITTGKGDCGSYSMLLVALFRQIGFPARTACGAWQGQDNGHCWSEMWFPTAGWVLSDGSIGDGVDGSGDFAYYFGSIPDLNIRFAMMRGNTFNVKDFNESWLQGPAGPWIWGQNVGTQNYDAHSALVEVTKSEADSFVQSFNQNTGAAKKKSFDTEMQRHPMPAAPRQSRLAPGGFRMKPTIRLIPRVGK